MEVTCYLGRCLVSHRCPLQVLSQNLREKTSQMSDLPDVPAGCKSALLEGVLTLTEIEC